MVQPNQKALCPHGPGAFSFSSQGIETMSSRRKIAANRANAKLSTGPNTAEGKEHSKYNALRHGLTGKQVVIEGEDPSQYEALCRDLIEAYQPADAAEMTLVQEIAQNYWRLQRARAMEVDAFNLFGNGTDPIIALERATGQFERIRRYMTAIERAYHRAIDQLQETQKSRLKLESAKPAQSSDGFVSQPSQVQSPVTLPDQKVMAVGQRNAEPVPLSEPALPDAA
jgi:hypothetical protein